MGLSLLYRKTNSIDGVPYMRIDTRATNARLFNFESEKLMLSGLENDSGECHITTSVEEGLVIA